MFIFTHTRVYFCLQQNATLILQMCTPHHSNKHSLQYSTWQYQQNCMTEMWHVG